MRRNGRVGFHKLTLIVLIVAMLAMTVSFMAVTSAIADAESKPLGTVAVDGIWDIPNPNIFPGGATCDRWATGSGDYPTAVNSDDRSIQNMVIGDENQVRYGWLENNTCQETSFADQSGFGFDGNEEARVDLNEPFALGKFTHYNNCIVEGTFELLIVPLNFELDFGDGNAVDISLIMTLDETDNHDNCPDCCDDSVSIETQVSNCFDIPGLTREDSYQLRVLGFATDSLDTPATTFITEEGEDNVAFLMVQIECCGWYGQPAVPAAVTPEMATFTMMIFGLAVLGALAWLRRHQRASNMRYVA